jgi:mRNA interferase RelE/StbE
MAYDIFILHRAQKELGDLPPKAYDRVRDEIRLEGQNSRPSTCVKLTGREGWRIRVGDYRIIYEIDDKKKIVTVLHVGLRKDVYRK